MEMVSSALRSASLMPTPTPKNTFLADEVQKYKPAVEIYQALSKKVGKEATPQEVYLLSRYAFSRQLSLSSHLQIVVHSTMSQ
jgi:hypothetical protein